MHARLVALLLAAIALFGWGTPSVAAATYVYGPEGFETGAGGWAPDNGVWEFGEPTSGPGHAHEGTAVAATVLAGGYPGMVNSRLISPAIQLPQRNEVNERLQLRFWHWYTYAQHNGQVTISLWTNGAWADWQYVDMPAASQGNQFVYSSGGWSPAQVDLTAFAGRQLRIGFLHSSFFFGADGWYLDEVAIWQGVPQFPGLNESFEAGWGDWYADHGVWGIGAPSGGPGMPYNGGAAAGTVLGGDYPAFTDSRLISPEFEVPTVASPDERVQLRFWQWSVYAQGGGNVDISVWTGGGWGEWQTLADVSPGSSNQLPSANPVWSPVHVDLTAYAGVRVRVAFSHIANNWPAAGWYVDDVEVWQGVPAFADLRESFESGWGDWQADHGLWEIGSPTSGPGTAHEGSSVAGTILGSDYPTYSDSRLISPEFEVPQPATMDECVQLRFWQWYAYTDGGGSVQVSFRTNGQWSAWQTLAQPAQSENNQLVYVNSVWSPAHVDLTAFAGMRVRVAFLHSANNWWSSGWYLDAVEIWRGVPQFLGLREFFETGWGDWHADRGVWQIGVATYGPDETHQGGSVAGTVLAADYPSYTDSRLVSPEFDLPAPDNSGERVELRFWHWFAYAQDAGRVEISVWDNGTWGAWQTLATPAAGVGSQIVISNGKWEEVRVDLSAFTGRRVRLAFHHLAGYWPSAGWYIDGVTVWRTSAPLIVESPHDLRANEGDPATFCPNVFGSLPLTYEWYKDGLPVEGGTQLCLVIDAAQEEDEGSYWVTVSNTYGEAMSMPAQLTVVQPADYPMLTEQPVGTNVNVGEMVTLCVSATGTDPLRYQWRKNGLNLPGETNECLVIPAVTSEDGGAYTVVVENDFGAVTSDPATVTILGLVVMPGADDFEDRVPLTGDSGQVRGNNTAATKQVPQEPKHANRPGKHSHWYAWTPSADGIATFSTAGSNFDTLLAVYTGSTLDALVPVAADEDGGKFYTSDVRFNALQGQAYAIAIDGFANRSGDYVLSWNLEVTAETLPVISVSGQPQSVVVEALGALAQFSVTATGSDLAYQWYRNGDAIPNATNAMLAIDPVTPGDLGRYVVEVMSGSRMVTTAPATLEVGNLGGYPTRDKVEDLLLDAEFEEDMGAGGSLGGGVPLLSLGFIGQQIWNNTSSGNQVGEANHCGTIGSASTWFRFQVVADGILQVDTTGMETHPALAIYTNILEGQGALTDVYPNLQVMACSDTLQQGATTLRSGLRAGVNYWLAMDNPEGQQGTNYLNWRFGTKARLQESALVALLPEGTNVFLDAGMISDTPPPSEVQWYLNNDPIVGHHSTVIPLYALSRDLSGVFRVVLGNFAGRTTNVVGVVSTFDQFKFKNYQKFGFVSGRTNFTIVANFSVPVVIEATDVLCSELEPPDCTEWMPVFTNEVPNVSFEFLDPDALFPSQPGIEDPGTVKPARYYRMRLFVPEQ